jgi:hypothetical protein
MGEYTRDFSRQQLSKHVPAIIGVSEENWDDQVSSVWESVKTGLECVKL